MSSHRVNIFILRFGISIVCNRSSNEYYIENEEDIKGSGIRNWMMSALSMNNILTESVSQKST